MTTRTRWLIRHPLQSKYLLIVAASMLAPLLVLGFCFYKLVFHLLAQQMAFPEAIMSNLMPVIDSVNALLIIVVPLMALVILWFAVAISHQFVGPIQRMEGDLDKILAGDRGRRIHLREKDDLTGVASRINALLDQIKN